MRLHAPWLAALRRPNKEKEGTLSPSARPSATGGIALWLCSSSSHLRRSATH